MRDAGQAVGQLLFLALLIGGIVWFIVYLSRRKPPGPGQYPQQYSPGFQGRWQHAVAVCSADPRYRLGRVDSVTHSDPSRGTRAWVTWYPSQGPAQDVWFQNAFPPIGAWLVTTGVSGGGGHGEPAFHVDRVHEVIS